MKQARPAPVEWLPLSIGNAKGVAPGSVPRWTVRAWPGRRTELRLGIPTRDRSTTSGAGRSKASTVRWGWSASPAHR